MRIKNLSDNELYGCESVGVKASLWSVFLIMLNHGMPLPRTLLENYVVGLCGRMSAV